MPDTVPPPQTLTQMPPQQSGPGAQRCPDGHSLEDVHFLYVSQPSPVNWAQKMLPSVSLEQKELGQSPHG